MLMPFGEELPYTGGRYTLRLAATVLSTCVGGRGESNTTHAIQASDGGSSYGQRK